MSSTDDAGDGVGHTPNPWQWRPHPKPWQWRQHPQPLMAAATSQWCGLIYLMCVAVLLTSYAFVATWVGVLGRFPSQRSHERVCWGRFPSQRAHERVCWGRFASQRAHESVCWGRFPSQRAHLQPHHTKPQFSVLLAYCRVLAFMRSVSAWCKRLLRLMFWSTSPWSHIWSYCTQYICTFFDYAMVHFWWRYLVAKIWIVLHTHTHIYIYVCVCFLAGQRYYSNGGCRYWRACFLYCDWLSVYKVTKVRYGFPYPWPLRWILPWRKQRDVKSRLACNGWKSKTMEEARCLNINYYHMIVLFFIFYYFPLVVSLFRCLLVLYDELEHGIIIVLVLL